MWEKVKDHVFSSIGFYTALLILVWLVGWAMNAVHGYKFDLNSLKELYIWLAGQLNVTHLINSKWNSPDGMPPK